LSGRVANSRRLEERADMIKIKLCHIVGLVKLCHIVGLVKLCHIVGLVKMPYHFSTQNS
jgi:hypothetical protein